MLHRLVERWKTTGCWAKIKQKKRCFVERSDQKTKISNILTEYKNACNISDTRGGRNSESAGAILFCVFRGRFSEGINFSDGLCRAVVVIGVPYPNMM